MSHRIAPQLVAWTTLFVLLTVPPALAQSPMPPSPTDWQVALGTPAMEKGYLIAQAGDGRVIVAGTIESGGSGSDFLIHALDASGNLLWTTVHDGEGQGADVPVGLGLDAAGDIYVAGQTASITSGDWLVIKLDAAGNLLWERTHHGTDPISTAVPRQLHVSPDGRVTVAGWSREVGVWTELGVAVWNTAGDLLWASHDGAPGFAADDGRALHVDDQGNVTVTGQVATTSGSDIHTAHWDAAGNLLWSHSFDAGTNPFLDLDVGLAVTTDADHNVYVAGQASATDTSLDFITLKYDPAGQLLWSRRLERPGADSPHRIEVLDGRLHVSGIYNLGLRIATYDLDGNLLWTETNLGLEIGTDQPRGHLATAPGLLHALGHAPGVGGLRDLVLVTYNAADGTLVESRFFDHQGGSDSAGAVIVGNNGILMTGVTRATAGGQRDVLVMQASAPALSAFRRGDCDADGAFGIGDAVVALGVLFGSQPTPQCPRACDANDDGSLDLGDPIATLSSLFLAAGPLPAPHAECGPDPTPDPLPCLLFPACP